MHTEAGPPSIAEKPAQVRVPPEPEVPVPVSRGERITLGVVALMGVSSGAVSLAVGHVATALPLLAGATVFACLAFRKTS